MRIVTRNRQERQDADRREERQDHYDQFVAAFGPASGLTDQHDHPELLRGRTWEYSDDDVLDEADPRVQRVVALVTTQSR